MKKQNTAMDTKRVLVMEKEEVPFFTDETAFLDAVFGKDGENWTYFVRVLLARYRWLFEREREIGRHAPVGAGWYVPLEVPQDPAKKALRNFDIVIGSCDAEDIIMDALERC